MLTPLVIKTKGTKTTKKFDNFGYQAECNPQKAIL